MTILLMLLALARPNDPKQCRELLEQIKANFVSEAGFQMQGDDLRIVEEWSKTCEKRFQTKELRRVLATKKMNPASSVASPQK